MPSKKTPSPTSPAARRRAAVQGRPTPPAMPAAFKESTAAVTAGALARAIFADPEGKGKPEEKEIPEWRSIIKLRKYCPTLSMLVGKRQGLKQGAKEIEEQVKAIDDEIGAALDMALDGDLKSVRVDERRVTRVEAYNGFKVDPKEFITELINQLIILGLDIEAVQTAIATAKEAAKKPNNRKAHIQISDIKGAKDKEE